MIPAPIQRTGAIRVHVSHWSWSAANGGEYRLGSTRLRAGVGRVFTPDELQEAADLAKSYVETGVFGPRKGGA